jgi:hypothetical protein
MARDLIYQVLLDGMMLDDEGNYIGCPKDLEKSTEAFLVARKEDSRFKYLCFKECEELRSISLADAANLSSDKIKEKYLYDTLPYIRNIMRIGSLTPNEFVSDEVPDDYLDQIICTAWKADLMIWCYSWDKKIEEKGDLG